MNHIRIISIFNVILVCFRHANAKSCKVADDREGECKPFKECEPLLTLTNNKVMTPEVEKLLQNSQCGSRGNEICCPEPCYTPEGHPGLCIGLYSCPHMMNMLSLKPLPKENIEYVRNSVCSRPEERSVCCGPPTSSEPLGPVPDCNTVMTAFPPDPRTGCCGIDSIIDYKGAMEPPLLGSGYPATIDEQPWLVAIEYTTAGVTKLFCGGGLISSKYVLTAGHCVVGQILKYGIPKNVRLGEYDTENEGPDCVPVENGGTDCTDGALVFPIEQTVPHPLYQPHDPHRKHDIALIRLKNTAPYTYFIRPICLPTEDHAMTPPPRFTMHEAGWGRNEQIQNETYLSNVKYRVLVQLKERESCQNTLRRDGNASNIVLWKGQICAASETDMGSCWGASGGPLAFEAHKHFEAVGIVSFGPMECGASNVPRVYTNVYNYLPWIRSIIKP